MVNVKKIQANIDKLLRVFTNLITALENAVAELRTGIAHNNHLIAALEKENVVYSGKISEYETLMESIKNVVKPTEKI